MSDQPPMRSSQQVGPPPKKARSGGVSGIGDGSTSRFGGDAIARRRAELRKLQQRGGVATGPNDQTRGLLEKARNKLQAPPQPQPIMFAQKHSSDIFPSVQKAEPSSRPVAFVPSVASSPLRPQAIVPTNFSAKPPKPPLAATSKSLLKSPTTSPQNKASTRAHEPVAHPDTPTPASKAAVVSATMPAATPHINKPSSLTTSHQVARRLDAKFANEPKTTRAKSAPPARPPPPPPPPSLPIAAEAPPKLAPSTKSWPLASSPPKQVGSVQPAKSQPKSVDDCIEPYLMPEKPSKSKYVSNRPQPITPTLGVKVQSLEREKEPTKHLNRTNGVAQQKIKNPTGAHDIPTPVLGNKTETKPAINNDEPAFAMEDSFLARELKKAAQEKEDAYRQIARLKEQLQHLEKERERQVHQTTIDPTKQERDQRDTKRGRLQSTQSQVQFMSPPSFRATSPSRRASTPVVGPPVRQRVATPNPTRLGSKDELEFLKLAAKSNPIEYTSVLAVYTVRRPYSAKEEDHLWKVAGVRSTEDYENNANVLNPPSIEIAATIRADGSTFVLHGDCDARHKRAAQNWRDFSDVEGMDRPLGCIMYIDQEADEGEYWLDDVYEEALSTRETYCSSLISAASALRVALAQKQAEQPQNMQQPQPQRIQMQQHSQRQPAQFQPPQLHREEPVTSQPQKVQFQQPQMLAPPPQQPAAFAQNGRTELSKLPDQKSAQQGVVLSPDGGSELPKLPKMDKDIREQKAQIMQVRSTSKTPALDQKLNGVLKPLEEDSTKVASAEERKPVEKNEKEVAKSKKKRKSPPPLEEEPTTDMLSSMLGLLFSSIFGLVWLVMVRIPYRIVSLAFLCIVLSTVYKALWLYTADDHGAIRMNAGVGLGFNQAGVL